MFEVTSNTHTSINKQVASGAVLKCMPIDVVTATDNHLVNAIDN